MPFGNGNAMLCMRFRFAMASPPPPGHRATSLTLAPELAAFLDAESRRWGISKAGLIRRLIARAMEAGSAVA
jgi:hypothetical protein